MKEREKPKNILSVLRVRPVLDQNTMVMMRIARIKTAKSVGNRKLGFRRKRMKIEIEINEENIAKLVEEKIAR